MSTFFQRQRLVQINSKDRINPRNTTSSQFTITLGNDEKINSVRGVAIQSTEFVNAFYNLDYYNNKFYFHTGGGEQIITIPIGQYNITTLIAELIAKLGALGVPITATIVKNALTHKLTWNTNVALRFYQYRPGTDELNPISEILGIIGDTDVPVLSYNSDGIPDLCGVKSVYVISKELSGGSCISSRDGGQKLSLLDSIAVNAGFLEVNYSNGSDHGDEDSHAYDDVLQNNLSTISIELRDSNNNLLNNNGHDFVCILKIFY